MVNNIRDFDREFNGYVTKNKNKLNYSPRPGSFLKNAIQNAIDLAKDRNKTITLRFNDVGIDLDRRSSVERVHARYKDVSEKKVRAYRASPEGIAAAARRAEIAAAYAIKMINDQKRIHELVHELREATKGA